MLFPMLTAEWGSTEKSRQNIIILLQKYLVDIRSEAWLNLFWEYINGNIFAVYSNCKEEEEERKQEGRAKRRQYRMR